MNKEGHAIPFLFKRKINELITLTDTGKSLLLTIIKHRQVAKNEYLLQEGQICRHIYFIESGCLRTFYNKDGKEINLNFALANNFTTNLKSLRTGSVSGQNIQAIEPASVIEFDKQALFELYQQSNEITSLGRILLELLLMEQEEHTHIFKLLTPKERYHYLEKNNPELLQKVSLSQLATYLGVSRETLSRIRKQ